MKEYGTLEKLLSLGRKIIPRSVFKAAQPIYHYILAVLGAIIYGFPAKKLVVVGVTGTKGKSTTTELVNAILETAGYKTAVANTIRYKIGDKEWRNMFKMTLRGRFFTQSFLSQAVQAGCTHAIIEVSSEGVPQSRHKFLYMNALIFTNLAPEHIESHGSYENYVRAKVEIAKELENSNKKNRVIIVNSDDKEAEKFLNLGIDSEITYSLHQAINVKVDESGSSFQVDKTVIYMKLPGLFNVYNALGAIAYAKHVGIGEEEIKKGLEGVEKVRGRMEKIENDRGIEMVVDYAHTTDSLRAVYEVYKDKKIIAVLGNTGGGRDKWKRVEMAKVADQYASEIILTNEDPYDEDPMSIVEEMRKGIVNKSVEIIMDRREAIRSAILKAGPGDAVLITGKGTDPYIMLKHGQRQKWDDATVVREELEELLKIETEKPRV